MDHKTQVVYFIILSLALSSADDTVARRTCRTLGFTGTSYVKWANIATVPHSYVEEDPEFLKCVGQIDNFLNHHRLSSDSPLDRMASACGSEYKLDSFKDSIGKLLDAQWNDWGAIENVLDELKSQIYCSEPKYDRNGKFIETKTIDCVYNTYIRTEPYRLRDRSHDYSTTESMSSSNRKKALNKLTGSHIPKEYWERYGRTGLFKRYCSIFSVRDELYLLPQDYFERTLQMYERWVVNKPEEKRCTATMVWKIDEFGKLYEHYNTQPRMEESHYHRLFEWATGVSGYDYYSTIRVFDRLATERALPIGLMVSGIEKLRMIYLRGIQRNTLDLLVGKLSECRNKPNPEECAANEVDTMTPKPKVSAPTPPEPSSV